MSETWMLPCELNEEERLARGQQLAKLVDLKIAKEQEKKSEAKRLKEEEDEIKERIVSMAQVIHTGKEDRPVEVTEVADLKKRVIETFRTDTSKLVSSRAMTATEVAEHEQRSLPFGFTGDKDEEPKKQRGKKAAAAESETA